MSLGSVLQLEVYADNKIRELSYLINTLLANPISRRRLYPFAKDLFLRLKNEQSAQEVGDLSPENRRNYNTNDDQNFLNRVRTPPSLV